MAEDPDNIAVGANSRILRAPLGTTVPTTVADAYAAGWVEVGYTDRAGFSFEPSIDITDVEVAQDMFTPRKIVTGRGLDVSFTMKEFTSLTLGIAFGGGEFDTATGITTYTPPDPEDIDEAAYAFEWIDGTKVYRFHVARGMVSSLGNFTVGPTEELSLEVTLSVLGAGSSLPYSMVTNDPSWVQV